MKAPSILKKPNACLGNFIPHSELSNRAESMLNLASAIAGHLSSETLSLDKEYEGLSNTMLSIEVITTEGIKLMLIANEDKQGVLSGYEAHVLNTSKLASPSGIKYITQSAKLDLDNQILEVEGHCLNVMDDEVRSYYQPVSDVNQINYLTDMIFTAEIVK